VAFIGLAKAEEADRPTVWIELGGKLDRISGDSETYAPPFIESVVQHGMQPPSNLHFDRRYSLGEVGSVSFQPKGSTWTFVAKVQYGRSSGVKRNHQEIYIPPVYVSKFQTKVQPKGPNNSALNRTSDYNIRSAESHSIVDFQVGKDVGLGLWGRDSSSQLFAGIRIAQFGTRTKMNLHADPNPYYGLEYKYFLHRNFIKVYYQSYNASPDIHRAFHGIGPSLSWTGSAPIADHDGEAKISFDWSVSAAVLFGRQKTRIHDHITGHHFEHNPITAPQYQYVDIRYENSVAISRSRSVVVPNVGGLAGVSLKFPNAKVSFGYRADFFFGAIDGGVSTRQGFDRGFFGPFATISVGLGG